MGSLCLHTHKHTHTPCLCLSIAASHLLFMFIIFSDSHVLAASLSDKGFQEFVSIFVSSPLHFLDCLSIGLCLSFSFSLSYTVRVL